MPRHQGALPDFMLAELIRSGHIKNGTESAINPSSMDHTLSAECYRVEGIIQPRVDEPVRETLALIGARPHDLRQPMEVGVSYLARLNEVVRLPQCVYAYCNPKSSTGRNDVHCRVLADGVPSFDAITPAGHRAEMWVAIIPKSYPVIIPEGTAVVQSRFFTADTRFSEVELEMEMERNPLVLDSHGDSIRYSDLRISKRDGSVLLTLDLASRFIGYHCRKPSRVLDFGQRGYCGDEFFEPIPGGVEMLRLHHGEFYILSTCENVCIPPHLSCEMKDIDSRMGEFRSHYAGYVDAGWGFGKNGSRKGRPLTLEVRTFEDIVIRLGQAVARIRFERMAELPENHYDMRDGSHYRTQRRARLSKHFV